MIRCEGLTAGYGKKRVIHNIGWKPAEGKLTVIIGPNGCGKTTLLKSLIGQTEITGGCVYLDEKPLECWKNKDIAKRLAYLPQNRSDTNISVFRMALHGRFPYLAWPRRYTDHDEEMVIRAAESMGLRDSLDKPVSDLSGGEKQRAYLMMALVQDAPVMLLDEPTTYLDISAQLELLGILRKLADSGKTVITVLHDLNQALRYAQEIVLMAEGEIRQCGLPEEILRSGSMEDVFCIHIHTLRDESGETYYSFS